MIFGYAVFCECFSGKAARCYGDKVNACLSSHFHIGPPVADKEHIIARNVGDSRKKLVQDSYVRLVIYEMRRTTDDEKRRIDFCGIKTQCQRRQGIVGADGNQHFFSTEPFYCFKRAGNWRIWEMIFP